MDGTHTLARAFTVTGRVLQALYTELHDQRIDLRGTLLKPNMVLSGYEASDRAGVEEVADATLECFYRHVPAAVPGIVFLSGGQTDEDATAHLNAMTAKGPHPWPLSFSYGRALQAAAQKAWSGTNVEAGQRAFYHRAKMNSAATHGPVRARDGDGGGRVSDGLRLRPGRDLVATWSPPSASPSGTRAR